MVNGWSPWEIKDVIEKLKNNKAAGNDGIKVELSKMGLDKLKARQHRLIVKVWDTEQIPEHWKQGIICSVNKKGNQLECKNYRAITIINVTYIVFSQIIINRLSARAKNYVRLHLIGFLEERSTTTNPPKNAASICTPLHQFQSCVRLH